MPALTILGQRSRRPRPGEALGQPLDNDLWNFAGQAEK